MFRTRTIFVVNVLSFRCSEVTACVHKPDSETKSRLRRFCYLSFLIWFWVTAVPRPEILLLAGAVEVNALAEGALRRFTRWSGIDLSTFQLRGGHSTTEQSPPNFATFGRRWFSEAAERAALWVTVFLQVEQQPPCNHHRSQRSRPVRSKLRICSRTTKSVKLTGCVVDAQVKATMLVSRCRIKWVLLFRFRGNPLLGAARKFFFLSPYRQSQQCFQSTSD